MLYNSNNSERQDDRASSNSGAGAGPGATKTKITNDMCCSDALLEPVERRQHSDNSSTYTRQISQDSGNASDCRDSDVARPEAAAASWIQPSTDGTGPGQQHDTAGAHRCHIQETPASETKPGHAPSEPSNRDLAQRRSAPSHSSHATSIDSQRRVAPKSAHQGTSQKSWAASRPTCSGQSFSEAPECCLAAKPTEASCCPAQAQPGMSGQQDRGGGGDPPFDEPCEPEEPEEPLDYKPILAKILNEKKLALISMPEVITFLSSGKAASGVPPDAHRRTRM